MDNQVLEIRKHLKKKLDPFRFEHTLGVTYTCQALAMRYGYDLKKAGLAGLLHDCAKRFDNAVMMEKCLKRGIPVTDSEVRDPSLLHAKLGAYFAKEKYGVEDEEILNAIACHTTGRSQMTMLDKILYVADYIEPNRYKAAELPEMRKLAFENLDLACLSIMESILKYLESTNCPIDPITADACEDMRKIVSQKAAETAKRSSGNLAEIQGAATLNPDKKEEHKGESVKRNGKNRRTRTRREKRRRY